MIVDGPIYKEAAVDDGGFAFHQFPCLLLDEHLERHPETPLVDQPLVARAGDMGNAFVQPHSPHFRQVELQQELGSVAGDALRTCGWCIEARMRPFQCSPTSVNAQ